MELFSGGNIKGMSDTLMTISPDATAWEKTLLERVRDAVAAGRVVRVESETPSVTPQEMADALGLSRATIMRRISDGEIAVTKRGNRHRIAVSEMERFRSVYIRELAVAFADDF